MAIFIDTNIFVASQNKDDDNHEKAKNLLYRIIQKQYGSAFTSDYVADEGTTLVFARTHSRRESNAFLNNMLNSGELFTIIYTTQDDFNSTAHEYFKQSQLSFTDCSIIILMKNHGIKNIATFDQGFNGIKGIEVINE